MMELDELVFRINKSYGGLHKYVNFMIHSYARIDNTNRGLYHDRINEERDLVLGYVKDFVGGGGE